MTRREELIAIIKRLPRGLRTDSSIFDSTLKLVFVAGYLDVYGFDAEGKNMFSGLFWDVQENKELLEDLCRASAAARELVEMENCCG